MSGVLLEANAVAKHFGGVKALRDVSLSIRQGEIYGLIGPNGAGKTTFFNCMTGLYVPDGGGFVFDGAPLIADAPHQAAERGIARTFQNIRLFGNMTALENVMLHYVRIEERAEDLAKNLSYGDQRRLEIARALATEPKLLCLDEPAAGMNATETAELRDLVDGIRRDGTTVLLIEHDVKLVMGLCDRVAVLDYGALVIEDVPAIVQKDQRVIEAYLGA